MIANDLLMPEAMLAASAVRTGLSDFGDPAVREGFDLLLSDIRALDLPETFAQATAGRIGQSLDARAMAVDGLKAHRAVLDTPIRQPLIIAGLVRSGTTALHQLLSLDPQFQGPEHWLTVAPRPRPPRVQWTDIPCYRAIADGIAAFVASAPEMLDDHMMSAEGIEESLFILASGFASNMWPSMWPLPRYDDWYLHRDDSDSYRWLADVLRLIGKGDERRWLLKNPTDLFSLREVLTVFPDAMVVQTHRDPVDAMPSICNLILAAQRVFAGDRADAAAIGRREREMWATALDRAAAVRATSANRFFDIEFRDFTADQLGTVKRLYARFDLTLDPSTEAAMRDWLCAHPRRAAAGPRYRPEDFALTADGLRARFADYRARRGYA
jgi:hypothetical protein